MSDIRGTVGIYTLGCKVNQYESEAIAERCEELGLTVLSPDNICDAYIINTCTVTAEADRKARQFIRRARAHGSEVYIIVTGCYAQTSADKVAQIGGVDYICGNSNKLSAADAAAQLISSRQKNTSTDIYIPEIYTAPFESMHINSFGRTRACIKIEDGCESHCTYCIIPSARGKIRSKPQEDVLREIRTLTENGCREVVLTGIETASYGRDLDGTDLASLLSEVDKIEGIGRVRLGSLDPSLFKPAFIEKIAPLRSLTPHFHLSLQSGSDSVLAGMRRKYNAAMAMRAIESIRTAIPHVQFTADMIVGFPGETDQNFAETLEFVEQARLLSIHVFAYSRRAGTVAASMPDQIPESVKHDRSASLIQKQAQIKKDILQNVISSSPDATVLFETYDGTYAYGHTDSFIEIKVPLASPPPADIVPIKLLSTDGEVCTAKLI
ncbi:MAG: tRNA (N(6)-L-threonylcarbamoyladenosine(37)-C(2))-methylthiotransferase MtaB [Clostridia bacterium]|nr:tRNA (N(6)-L-threonylcarbamoyladenosine(37)-C(2))-methylthiotransferase MtaB [Clostridia bacterium]